MTTEIIPQHLREYITDQDPSLYTWIDHATWRYVMRVAKAFFSKHGHPLYLQGITATGMSTERIPLVSEMDTALREFGWRAVAVNGFIPPSIFLEFQSLKILAIACDIRTLEHLGYTPSPDIIHEAAGHAPIVADPGYRTYLEAYGQIVRNAIISKYDLELYEAIFNLSELKEDPHTAPELIEEAQRTFEKVASRETHASEAAVMARMAWWTTEYGLVGPLDKPLIYGAGLLSSVSESYHCLNPEVKKIPFSLDAVLKTSYDITRPQPQLFISKDFEELTRALDQFADQMAFRRGGVYGLETAKIADHTVTVVFDNGLQVTGTVCDFDKNDINEETNFSMTGSKQISYLNQASSELDTHNIGLKIFFPLFHQSVAASNLLDITRKLHGSGLHTKSGLRIQGQFKKEVLFGGGLGRVLVLEHVKITDTNGHVVFEEHKRYYPLILASKVNSVFGGAADREEFALRHSSRSQKVKSHKTNLTEENRGLNELYRVVREFRETKNSAIERLGPIVAELTADYPQDWLLRVELLELFKERAAKHPVIHQLEEQLQLLARTQPDLQELIERGTALL